MRKFIAQFTPFMGKMFGFHLDNQRDIEARLFIAGCTGNWKSQKLGEVWAMYPESNESFRLMNYMNGADVTLSPKATGLVLSIMATAHLYERIYDRLSESQQERYVGIIDALKDAIWTPAFKAESAAISRFID